MERTFKLIINDVLIKNKNSKQHLDQLIIDAVEAGNDSIEVIYCEELKDA